MRRRSNAAVPSVTAALVRRNPLPVPAEGGKDERGRILIVAGARELAGAAILAATAALRAGAGKLQIITAASIATHIGTAIPESMVIGLPEKRSGAIDPARSQRMHKAAQQTDAIVFGPGLVEGADCTRLLAGLLKTLRVPAVLDAAALASVPKLADAVRCAGANIVLTPHAGEMAGVLGISRKTIEGDPMSYAIRASREFRCVVALKGARTYIACPDGKVYCNRSGTVGLATSGSGDTLAGIIGGLLARGVAGPAATLWGVFLHAQAGAALTRKVGMGFLARELLAEIPPIMKKLSR